MKEAPFYRLVIPFIGGVATTYYYNVNISITGGVIAGCFIIIIMLICQIIIQV